MTLHRAQSPRKTRFSTRPCTHATITIESWALATAIAAGERPGDCSAERMMGDEAQLQQLQQRLLLKRVRWSVDDYHRMAEVGLLGPEDRVELIDGEIIRMAPIGLQHAASVSVLSMLFARATGGEATVWTQNPVRLSKQDELQPDLLLLSGTIERYWSALPMGADVLLAVEVARTSLKFDQSIKAPLYARHGIHELWIVDLNDPRVLVYSAPGPDGYAFMREIRAPATIAPSALPAVRLDVAAFLGPNLEPAAPGD
jgi:Uma2 family endonuclease